MDGTVLYTDSTRLKANANKGKYDLAQIEKSRSDYWADLDKAIEAERKLHGQKPLNETEREPKVKQTKVSRTDPDSGYMVREGKPKGFFYLDHRTVDGRLGIVTDTFATPANVHDSIVYLSRLNRQRNRFGFEVAAVGLDAGYATSGIARGLETRDIPGVTGYRRPTVPRPGMMRKSAFSYETQADGYRCPEGQLLSYATTGRNGYKHYRSDPAICGTCPLLASCTSNAGSIRTLTRHVWQESAERGDAHRLTAWGKASTSAARKPWNARLPMPGSFMATDMPGSEVLCASKPNAYSPQPHRTSKRSQWPLPRPQTKPPRDKNIRAKYPIQKRRQSPQNKSQKNKPAEIDGFVSSLSPPIGGFFVWCRVNTGLLR